ncbi:MAG: type I polyketide synthase, partial [Bryobacteraceae bacterium]
MYLQIPSPDLEGIALVGMAGRFPGAPDARRFWENLANGVESISRFSVNELEVRDAARQAKDSNYITARGVLEGVDLFDAGFFGIYPQEAKLTDPQHRIFLECCWEALEDSGHDPARESSSVGVFAGCSQNSYFMTQVASGREYLQDYAAAYQVGFYPTMLGAMGDTLATRVAYKLNLTGPAVTLLCACSTALVAVCQACTSLLTWQCDMALAGAVSVSFPQRRGYLYQAGGMVSPDGHCRSFDADAQGTVFGSGAGVVLLKRLEDAVRDGDHIYAVIKGSAVNNDGAGKVGFTAPSVDGQAKVIAMAQAAAGVDPRSISYIEAHGTGTPLGDPIEIAALTQVFRESTDKSGFCAIGTAKTNVGHLDVASGVTGLIKTALSLEHKQLPPTLHFQSPNPKLNLETSPFFVNAELRDWTTPAGAPRRAGVSAFGVGGTNAHVVLEEAPIIETSDSPRPYHLLPLSARSPEALANAVQNLAEHLRRNPEADLADVGFTLQAGRRAFDHRVTFVCHDTPEAMEALAGYQPGPEAATKQAPPNVHFLFPGQGAQHVNMGRELYSSERKFRETIDRCAEILQPYLGEDLRDVMFADASDPATQQRLSQTRFAQPAIFTIEYALAQL